MSRREEIKKEDNGFISEAKIYCDGASSGNPGRAGIGVVIQVRGHLHKDYKISEYIGITTNNVAEYSALIRGLEEAMSLGLKKVEIFLDSELIVKQIKGEYRIRNMNLKPLWQKTKNILGQFKEYRLFHVPRELNRDADRLARKAIKNMAPGRLI